MSLSRSRLPLTWMALLLVLALYCSWRVAGGNAFESNILSLMPNAGQDLELTQFAASGFDESFVLLLSHPNEQVALELAGELGDQLNRHGASLADHQRDLIAVLRETFAPYRQQLLSDGLRRELQARTAEELAHALLRELHSPLPSLRLYDLRQDPFNLGGRWLAEWLPPASQWRPGELPSLRHGDQTWWILQGTLENKAFGTASHQVARVVAEFAATHPQAHLLRSGVVFHAAEAAQLARKEISTIGAGSLLGVLLLVLWTFRSRQALTAIAFTLLSSVLVALGVSFAVFGQVHLITLAFGSTLLGLAVDFCFHFLIKHQSLGDARSAGRMVRRGISISACSSIAAYLIQLWSPFPGLHQFAVFMAAGLIGAWGAVVALWHSYHAPHSRAFDRYRNLYPRYLANFYQRATARRWPWLVVLIAALPALGWWLADRGGRDDIRLLNTSSTTLLQEERKVQSLLGGIDAQRYWVVEGDSEQQVLENMEVLLAQLGDTPAVMAASQWVPSQARQRADHTLVMDKLYGPDGALETLCNRLGSDCREWRALPLDYQEGLTPSQLSPDVVALFPPLRLVDGRQGIVLTRQGGSTSTATKEPVVTLPGVRAVDQVEHLSNTLGQLRGEATLLLAVFIALFTLVCLIGFGRRGLLVVGSVVLSLGVSLALSTSGGISLFHILALLLVLGLSVDTAVFYLELGLNGETWLAATLAIATSMLAFGLLSLSHMPILHQFGRVVSVGLLCSWLSTPLLFHLLRLPTSHLQFPLSTTPSPDARSQDLAP